MEAYENFPAGTAERWLQLIERELKAPLPAGRPLPFYMEKDVPDWAELMPLPFSARWGLVAERFIPEEVDVWWYDPRFLSEGEKASRWLVVQQPLPEPPLGVEMYVLSRYDRPSRGIPVWELPIRIDDSLEVVVDRPFPPMMREGDAMALLLDQRVLYNAILVRAVRIAFSPSAVWALPVETLYMPTGMLPEEGPEENLIRATLYAMGAILGGTQWVYIPPIGDPTDPHVARWSRSISHILRHEVAHLAQEADPLAGSYYVEAESRRLAATLQALRP